MLGTALVKLDPLREFAALSTKVRFHEAAMTLQTPFPAHSYPWWVVQHGGGPSAPLTGRFDVSVWALLQVQQTSAPRRSSRMVSQLQRNLSMCGERQKGPASYQFIRDVAKGRC